MRYAISLLALIAALLVPAGATAGTLHITCVDGQPLSDVTVAKRADCDADGQVDGVCTFVLCSLCEACAAPFPVYLCDFENPIPVPVNKQRARRRIRFSCLPAS